jgi:hypothetical protein
MEEPGIVMEELKKDESPKGKLGNILRLVDIAAEKNKFRFQDPDGGNVRVIFSKDVKDLVRFAFVVAYTELGSAMVDQHREEAEALMVDANMYASTIAAAPLIEMTGLSAEEIGKIMNTKDEEEY